MASRTRAPSRRWGPADLAPCDEYVRLAEYLADLLYPEQQQRFEEHLAGCETCCFMLANSVRLEEDAEVRRAEALVAQGDALSGRAGAAARREIGQARARLRAAGDEGRITRRRAVAAAALVTGGAVLAAALGIGTGKLHGWRDPRAPLLVAAVQARPLEPRLTGGFRWAPPTEVRRGASPAVDRRSWGYRVASEEIRRAVLASPTGDRLGALADARLLLGSFDEALITLGRATAADPDDPRLHSDLAAAYLARGLANGDASDVATAVETASAVLSRAPRLLEARFNRALGLETLHLPHEARRAWEAYLEVETDPGWAAEARHHLEELSAVEPVAPAAAADELRRAAGSGDEAALSSLVAADRFAARRLVELELLREWGEAVLSGDGVKAKRALAAAGAIARVYASQTGEHRLTAQIEEARSASGEAARRLAEAHRALAAGEANFVARNFAEAQRQLERAVSLFPMASVGHRRATLELLLADYYAEPRANDPVAAVERLAGQAGYDLVTRARAFWCLGVLKINRGDLGAALRLYLEALAAFDRLGERTPAAWLHHLLAEGYLIIGDQRSSWRHMGAALAAAPSLDDRVRGSEILSRSAMWCLLVGRPRLAATLLDELSARGEALLPDQRGNLHLRRAEARLADRRTRGGLRRACARRDSSSAGQRSQHPS